MTRNVNLSGSPAKSYVTSQQPARANSMELPKLSLFIAPTREGAAPSSRRRPRDRDRPAPEGHRPKLGVLSLKDAVIRQADPERIVSYPVRACGPRLARRRRGWPR